MTRSRLLDLAEAALSGAVWLVLILGVTLQPLTFPAYTAMLVRSEEVAARTGLSEERAVEMAQLVRAFVSDPDARPLPPIVDGRPGFDTSMVSHLEDVRRVFLGARVATGVLAAFLAVWVLVSIALKRWRPLAAGLRVGGWLAVGAPLALALLGVLDFGLLFTLFHGLFFASGTWTFPYDALLIQLFPQAFWVTSGMVWALLVMACGAASVLVAARFRHELVER